MTTPQQRRTRFNRVALASSLMLGACTLPMGIAAVHAAEQSTGASQRTALIRFDIPAQSLDSAVLAFAEQAKVQVFFDSRKLAGLRSAGLSGEHSAQEGLSILLQDNPVRYRFNGTDRVGLERLSSDGKSLELNTTSIRSQGDGDWVYLAPRSVSVITRDQIDKRPPRHAADMLEETAGVYTAVNQRDPGLSVNIRGVQDYGRVNMNIDGMRQNFNVNGHQQRNGIMVVDPEFISSVEIENVRPTTRILGTRPCRIRSLPLLISPSFSRVQDKRHLRRRLSIGIDLCGNEPRADPPGNSQVRVPTLPARTQRIVTPCTVSTTFRA